MNLWKARATGTEGYWNMEKGDSDLLLEEGYLDHGKHVYYYNAKMDEWEVCMHGLYHHIFKSFKDMMANENEIDFYEYNAELTEEQGEEVITNSKGHPRQY